MSHATANFSGEISVKIANKTVVEFAYRLSDMDGKLLESRDTDDPQIYLHGARNILKTLESHLTGKIAGDSLQVTLEPHEAHGARRDDAEQRIPIKHLMGAKKWKPGMAGWVNTESGRHQVTVIKAGKFMVTVDTNHPLAGQKLRYDIDILSVREATPLELSHGHAHSPGGDEHHH
jgi:FKBP-type peptidyl-prolyl cis-trans isomerase SlyD